MNEIRLPLDGDVLYVQASATDTEDETEENAGNIAFGNVLGMEGREPKKKKQRKGKRNSQVRL